MTELRLFLFCPDRNIGKYVLTRKKPMMPRRLSGGRGIFIFGRTDGTLGTFRTDGTRMRRNQKDFFWWTVGREPHHGAWGWGGLRVFFVRSCTELYGGLSIKSVSIFLRTHPYSSAEPLIRSAFSGSVAQLRFACLPLAARVSESRPRNGCFAPPFLDRWLNCASLVCHWRHALARAAQ